jgi:hypothetical protein
MLTRPLLNRILGDEALVRGLGDPEARVLIEWLVDRAEEGAHDGEAEAVEAVVGRLCRRGRAIGRFVTLWCQGAWGAAGQLAVAERFDWPLPAAVIDPCILMQNILAWEERDWRRSSSGCQ